MTTQKDGTCELQMPSFVVVGAVVCDGKCRCMHVLQASFLVVDSSQQPC